MSSCLAFYKSLKWSLHSHGCVTTWQPLWDNPNHSALPTAKQSYWLHSHSANWKHDSQLPISPQGSHPFGLRAGSSGAQMKNVCVLVCMLYACVYIFRAVGWLWINISDSEMLCSTSLHTMIWQGYYYCLLSDVYHYKTSFICFFSHVK